MYTYRMDENRYVSRAGLKLERALDAFNINVRDMFAADLGCSTGGFTDCLLQRGAAKVYSVDTGYGVLDWKLRNDPRVVVMERTNALHVVLPEKMDIITIDVNWTRLGLIMPHALSLLKPSGQIVALLKPHYEADAHQLKGGMLDLHHLPDVLTKVTNKLVNLGANVLDTVESPLKGKKGGNTEYLLHIRPV